MLKKAILMRSGYMDYLESDILSNGKTNKIVKVYRSDEVLKRFYNTFKGVPLIDGHDGKTPIGTVVDVYYDKGLIMGLIDTDIQLSNVELSAGYESELTQIDDALYEVLSFEGEHVAIVDNGRCGEICKII